MATIENHQAILNELLEDIDEKIRNDLLVQRQKILAFALSEASCHIFSIFLLKRHLVSSGFQINHRFFASEKIAKERFGFDFERKEAVIRILVKQEELREKLCYGKQKTRENIEDAIKNFYELKRCIEEIP